MNLFGGRETAFRPAGCYRTIPVFFLFILAGCGAFPPVSPGEGTGNEIFAAAEWNVQALFDGGETGNEYGEYLEAAGWTAEKYAARITALSQAVLEMAGPAKTESGAPSLAAGKTGKTAVPDLIGLVELENAGVLEDLAESSLSKHGYFWTAFASLPGASLGIGVLSRFPLLDIRAHSVTIGKDTAPRPVLEVRVSPRGKPLVFLLCHWKSKLGGESATESLRRASARVVQRRLRELNKTEAGVPVIVMGDLNENHDEFFRFSPKESRSAAKKRSGNRAPDSAALPSALVPDTPEAAAAVRAGLHEGYLVISAEKAPRALHFPESSPALYSPWGEELEGGSFFYKGAWETIDHFLLSGGFFDGAGWEFLDSRVVNHAPFTASGGRPNAYIPRSGRGLSDHLPLLLYLKDAAPETENGEK